MKHIYAAVKLIEEAGLGVQGRDLFIGTMPSDVVSGIMLRLPITGDRIDEGMVDFYNTSFVLIVRDADAGAGYDRARSLSKVLTVDRLIDGDVYILKMNPETLPVSYPRGSADDVETSVSIHVAFGELP